MVEHITKSIWEQLIKVFQCDSYISSYKDNEINFISKFQTTGEHEQQTSKFQSQYSAVISLKNNEQIITMEIYGVGKIQKSMVNSKYSDVANKINNLMCQDDVIYWVEENSNFAVRKIINCQYLRQNNILQIRNYLSRSRNSCQQALRKSFMQLRENEELKSVSQPPSEIKKINLKKQQQSIQEQQSKKKAKGSKVRLKKKFIGLEYLKFQFEINRRKNTKSTNLDFNNYKLKSFNDILNLQQYCTQNNKSYIYALRQNYSKSQISAPQAQKNYLQLLETYHRKKQNKSSKSSEENLKILNSIGIRSQICLNNDKIQATFSHIEIVKSNYVTYLSTRQAVNNHINASQLTSFPFSLSSSQSTSSQNSENNYTRQSTNILVKKNKCLGCIGQTQERRKINQLVFQNQKQILLIFLDRYSPSICSYLIKQFDKKQDIKQIYSRMLPHTPIDVYFNSNKISSPVKFLKNALKFLLQVSEGVSFLYSSQIAHRDLKPTNIMLNENHDVKIIDFGSACTFFNSDVGLSQQFDFTLRSSPGYYSKYNEIPQEVRVKYTQQQYQRHRNFDVYSFGVIAERLCEKIPKFSSFCYETMIQNLNYLIRKCKDTNPEDRITPGQIVLFLNELSSSARILEDNV